MDVIVQDDQIRVGTHFTVSFQRTLRIPEDGRSYPLPPTLGAFPVRRVDEFAGRIPALWTAHGGFFIPMYQREALWLGFGGADWKPNAVVVRVGGVNALSGELGDERLHANPQSYLVVPDQPWLDGINAGEGYVKQFVAMPLGLGYTVEGQATGTESLGGVQLLVYAPKPGKFPEAPPPPKPSPAPGPVNTAMFPITPAAEMGLAAGGQIKQKIYPDPYGIETWDEYPYGRLLVYLVNSGQYEAITGECPPQTPITAKTYTEYGFPWFDLYDEAQGDVAAAEPLARIKSIRESDAEEGRLVAEESIDLPHHQVRAIRRSQTPERPDY